MAETPGKAALIYDGTNHEEVTRELVRQGRATKGGVHFGAPGDDPVIRYHGPEDDDIHEVRVGDQVPL